jgi:hypothetical protein
VAAAFLAAVQVLKISTALPSSKQKLSSIVLCIQAYGVALLQVLLSTKDRASIAAV